MADAAAAAKNLNFVWEGTDKKGNRIKGKTVAPNEAAVKADLRRQGIAPVKISKARRKAGKKIETGDIAFFSRQMSTMMSSGVPLVQSMDIIGKGHVNPNMQDMVMSIKADVASTVIYEHIDPVLKQDHTSAPAALVAIVPVVMRPQTPASACRRRRGAPRARPGSRTGARPARPPAPGPRRAGARRPRGRSA